MSARLVRYVVLLVALAIPAACNTTGPDRPALEIYVMNLDEVIPIGPNMAISMNAGAARQLFARLTFSDRDARDVSSEVTWSLQTVSAGASGGITGGGLVTGTAPGELRASAQYGPLREDISVIVEPQ